MIRVFQCEDNLTGILTGVYDAWDSRLGHQNVRLESMPGDMELFCEYVQVASDVEKAGKVLRTIRERLGEGAYIMIGRASVCPEPKKADAIYRMIVIGLHLPDGREIGRMLTCPEVRLVFELSRRAGRLENHYMGFIRFRELNQGILFAEFDPDVDILPLLGPHFEDRLPQENWMIYDRRRQKAAIHVKGKNWIMAEGIRREDIGPAVRSAEDDRFDTLWRAFHRAIAIESRKNERLQQSMMPLKFRPYMNEFTAPGNGNSS